MEIFQNDYILGSWYAVDAKGNNWLTTIVKRGDEWIGEYRFRYRKDEKIFDSDDEKSFYSFKVKVSELSEDNLIKRMNEMLKIISREYPLKNKFIEVRGDLDKWIYMMAQEDVMHIKRVPLKFKT